MKISVILPTYNESENIPLIVEKIEAALSGVDFEIVIVDDNSPDGSYKLAKDLAQKKKYIHPVKRVNDRGLSSAVMKGFSVARGQYLVVMDADMQHDETVLPQFIEAFEKGAELVIGSRKIAGGGIEDWSALRRFISWGATSLAKLLLPRSISDPMSGFFGVSRDFAVEIEDKINPRGFKILLEYIANSKGRRVAEVGYVFKPRQFGESKLSGRVMLQYLIGLYDLRFGKLIPIRFIKYGIVGASGVVIYLGGIWLSKTIFNIAYQFAFAIGLELSIVSNYIFNNFWTFKDRRFEGLSQNIKGLLAFHLISLAGVLINYTISIALYTEWNLNISSMEIHINKDWQFNAYFSAFIGIIISTAWNYMVNTQITWQQRRG